MNWNKKRWLKKLSKIERTLKNRKVCGRGGTKIKVEKKEVTGKGDTKKKSTFIALAFEN